MDATLLVQALLIATFAYLGWLATPYFGGVPIGWYTLGRPLIAGTIVGAILGDIKTGMIVGATINAFFIGAITPGGALAADMNMAGYVGTALAILGKLTPEQAVAAAVPIGLIGTFGWQAFSTLTVYWVHKADRDAENLNLKAFTFDLVWGPQILNFILRFIPVFLVVYLGAPIASNMSALIPEWLGRILTVIGSMLPAVGFVVLVKMMYRNNMFMLGFLLLGFLMVAVLKMPIVAVSMVGLALAGLVWYLKTPATVQA
jgi:PTS system mannose-specific IIC component